MTTPTAQWYESECSNRMPAIAVIGSAVGDSFLVADCIVSDCWSELASGSMSHYVVTGDESL